MAKIIELTGQTFGRWTVLKRDGIKNGGKAWICRCDCGTIAIIRGNSLRTGTSKSCGCLQRDIVSKIATKHGMHNSREMNSWKSMIQRCTNPNCTTYEDYGGRGISICKRWKKFENFYEDMGERPLYHSLERIDNNGDYGPDNCKWATQSEQSRNQRIRTSNTSGITGINWDKVRKKWQSRFFINNTSVYLGRFESMEDAIKAIEEAEIKYLNTKPS